MKRLRNAGLAVWYTLVKNRFSIRKGCLYMPESALKKWPSQNGIAKISLAEQRTR